MTIKVGDWVCFRDTNIPEAEQITRIRENGFFETKTWANIPPSNVIKLTPYASIDEVKIGDRCVIVESPIFFNLNKYVGSIVTVIEKNSSVYVKGINQDRLEYCPEWLAPIPRADAEVEVPVKQVLHIPNWRDHVADEVPVNTRSGPIRTISIDGHKFRCAEVEVPVKQEPVTEPLPCPHPEWQGVWDYCGDGYRVTWQAPDEIFDADRVDGNGRGISNWQPGEFWKQIETAPERAVTHPPQRHWIDKSKAHRDHLRTPWDPCDEG